MTPIDAVAAGVVAGVAVSPWTGGQVGAWVLLTASAGLAAILRGWWPNWLVLGVGLGVVAVRGLPPGPALDGWLAGEGVVVGAPVGTQADVALRRWSPPGGPWTDVRGRVRVRFPDRAPAMGAHVVFFGRAGPLARPVLPGDPDPVRSAARGRVRAFVEARTAAVVGEAPSGVDPFAGAAHGGVLRALATGDRAGVPDATWDRLRRTGTAHVLAISGFHVGLVAWMAMAAVQRLLRAVAVVYPCGVPDGVSLWVGLLAGAGYALLVGAPVSAQRAALLLAWVGFGRFLRRDPSIGRGLLVAAAVVVLVDPPAIATPGFQLSFGAVLGLLHVTPGILSWVPPAWPRWALWTASGMAASVGATVGTLPAAAWWFQQVAPWSPVANLFTLPLVAFVLMPCAAAVAWGPPALASVALPVGDLGVRLLLALLAPLDVAPWTPALGPVGAALVAAPLVIRGSLSNHLVAAGLAFGLQVRPSVPTITFLDVGQGDAALVEDGGTTVLVDGGPPGDGVLRWLRRRGTRRLDAVVVSHGHPDHTGGLAPVLEALDVGALWIPNQEGVDALLAVAAVRGIPVRIRPALALHPAHDLRPVDLNDRSLVIPLGGALFPGDLEREGEAAAPVSRAAVLKVPHHGSRTSSTDGFLDAVRPRLAVVSAGRGNAFGHPHAEVVARYAAHRVALLRTDRDGTVVVAVREDRLVARGWRPGVGWTRLGAWSR